MQSVSSRIWTRIVVSNSYDDNHYTTGTTKIININIHINIHKDSSSLAKWVNCSLMAQQTLVQSQVASYQRLLKWYLIPPCLTLSNIRYVLRVKWSTPGKGVAPFPTPRCSSNWKRSLLVVLDYGRQLYLQLYKYTYIHACVCEYMSVYVLIWFSLVWFYGTSTIVGYKCQIHFNSSISYKQFYFKQISLVYKHSFCFPS